MCSQVVSCQVSLNDNSTQVPWSEEGQDKTLRLLSFSEANFHNNNDNDVNDANDDNDDANDDNDDDVNVKGLKEILRIH